MSERGDLDRIPVAPGALPFFGHGLRLLADPLGFISSLGGKNALSRIRLGPLTIVMVCDPDTSRSVLLDDRTFDRGGPLYDRSREFAGNGLGTCTHSAHRRQRRLCQPAFAADRLPGYAQAMTASIDEVLASWSPGQTIDVSAEMSKLTVRVAVRTMFSSSFPAHLVDQVADDFAVIAKTMFRRMVMPPIVNRMPTPGNRRYYGARQRLRAVAADLIAQRRTDPHDQSDLLSALMRARDTDAGDDAGLHDEELVDQVFTFLFAGAETSASTLAWALYLLSQHPQARSQVNSEVDQHLTAATASASDLPNMPTLDLVLREALRLYPAGWLLTRVVSATTQLDGVTIPAGTIVAVSPHLIHRRADLYADPGEFAPERWHSTTAGITTYIPFGAGARRCIGDQFGLLEAGLALATITARWDLTPVSTRPVSVSLEHLPAPKNLMMTLTPRAHSSTAASA
ncbi:cytochrome P450 [Nocardia alni]|uniref:cytochrome P450 n=1 Tax=Nocardia alni TaxID=2815723 RepID=UPI001C25122D|nr:cytochrome P450 [Nocardia alni]